MTFEQLRVSTALRQIHFGCDVTDAAAAELFCALASMPGPKPVHVVINSVGGDVEAAIACYEAIRLFPAPVRGSVVGTCQSAAVLLYVACDERDISPNSTLMLHGGDQSLSGLHPKEFRRQAAHYDELERVYTRLIDERVPGASVPDFATYYSATQALETGFASDILEAKRLPTGARTAGRNPASGKAKCSRGGSRRARRQG